MEPSARKLLVSVVVALYRGADLTATNAGGTVELPMPTVVIVDAAGNVRRVVPDYTTRSEPDAILNALDETTST